MAPLWQDCVEFLRSAQLLGENVVIESLEQLAVLLSDGVILCKLAKLLKPESVEGNKILRRHSMNQRSNFLSSNNITLFLTACRRFLAVPEEYFFNIEDLSDYQNFEKVLRLVSYLSRSNYAQNLGLRGFHETQESPAEYINLPDLVEEHLDEYLQLNEIAYETENRENENIEQNLATTQYTPVVSGAPLSGEYIDSAPSNDIQRNYSLKELIDFECDYLKQLKHLALLYTQLEHDITRTDRDGLFYKIPELAQVHQNFYDELKGAVEDSIHSDDDANNNSTFSIGSICQNYKIELAYAYKQRIIGLEGSKKILKNLLRVNNAVKRHLNNQLLVGVLENPINKLCSYKLILNKLFKQSNNENFRADIKLGEEAFEEICHFLNKLCSRIAIVRDFADYLRDFPEPKDVLINYGNLLWDDRLEIMRNTKGGRNSSRMEKCHIFLFDAFIIICRQRVKYNGQGLELDYLEHHELKDFKLSPIKVTTTLLFTSSFQWEIDNSANGRSFNFVFKSKKKCERTHKDFENALNFTKPKGKKIQQQKHRLRSKIFSTPTACDGCNKIFDVLGYNCERCHKIFDFECLKKVPCLESASLESKIRPSDLLQVVDVQEDEVYVKVLGSSHETQVLKLRSDGEVCNVEQFYLHETIPRHRTLTQSQISQSGPLFSKCVLNIPARNVSIDSKIWYFGKISMEKADELLAQAPIGTFLFRYSQRQDRYILSIKCMLNINAYQNPSRNSTQSSVFGVRHLPLGVRFEGQSAGTALGAQRFNSFEDYINFFRQNHFDVLYKDANINTTLEYAVIRVNFRANFAFIMTATTGENIQIRPGDIITIVDTINEDAGFWQITVFGKPARIPWAFICEFCESISVEEISSINRSVSASFE